MAITAINAYRPNKVAFGNTKKVDKDGYENPINRGTEKKLAVLSSIGVSSLIGVTAGGITSCFTKGWKIPTGVGVAAGLASLLLALPSKLYNVGVNAFAKEKEMSVFSRQKEAQANIYNDINKEIQDEDVSLDDKIQHYTTVKMADNGNGMMIKGA